MDISNIEWCIAGPINKIILDFLNGFEKNIGLHFAGTEQGFYGRKKSLTSNKFYTVFSSQKFGELIVEENFES